jgi:acyl-coenzyme A synthetase/AMP-(fatty) acid ligase
VTSLEFLHAGCLPPERWSNVALRSSESGLSLSYGELSVAVDAVAEMLAQGGIGPGSRVVLMADASPEFVIGLLACAACGAAAAPIDVTLRGSSLECAMEVLEPDGIIGFAEPVRRLPEATRERAAVCLVLDRIVSEPVKALAGTARVGAVPRSLRASLAAPPGSAHARSAAGASTEDDCLLIATSGSTGIPKYVRLSHRSVSFNVRAHLASLGLEHPFRSLQVLSVAYSYGLISSLLGTLVAGGTVVFPARFDARAARDAIEREGPAVCLASPGFFESLVDGCSREGPAVLGRLRKIGIGGDRCPAPLRSKLQAAMPAVQAYVTYGATEAGPRISTLPPEHFLTRPLSVGLPLPGVSLAVLDSRGQPCPPGRIGTLHVRTPSRMSGYLGESSPLHPHALETGDLASLDEDGFLTVYGRLDRQIKHRGRRVNPAQIELVLLEFPGIVSARVEQSDASGGLRAVVHRRSSDELGFERALLAHCRRNLPARLVPGEIRTVVDDGSYFFKGKRLAFSET